LQRLGSALVEVVEQLADPSDVLLELFLVGWQLGIEVRLELLGLLAGAIPSGLNA